MRTPVLLLALLQLAAAKPLSHKRWDDFEVKHAWEGVPRGWSFRGPAPADHTFNMRIALTQDKFEDLLTTLYEVSDPSHHKYGQHLSKGEVEALVAPHPDSVNYVNEWLLVHGVDPSAAQRSNGGSWVTVPVTVGQASRMLNATYGVYEHETTFERVVRTISYSLPRSLHPHVGVVTPTTYFSTMKSMRTTSFIQPNVDAVVGTTEAASGVIDPNMLAVVPPTCNTKITPACLIALYGTESYIPKATKVNKLGVAGYLDQYANYADLQTFFKLFRQDAMGTTFQTVLVNGGGNNQSEPGVEANLDIQYTEGLSYPTPNIYYSTGGSPPFISDSLTPSNTNEPYMEWLDYILAQNDIPQTFTTSYGDNEQTVPYDYAKSVCNLFAQLGVRGSSVLFSSGDFGVGGSDCYTNDGKNKVQFQPIFPGGCPFVTTVGGTTRVNPEVAVSFSGGGFSNYFSRPTYQSVVVSSYLATLGDTYKGLYNPSGRAYPDVSAQGENFQVVVGNKVYSVGGTSASAPTVAAIISLINDYRLSQGKRPLGFLNPALYSNASAGFTDITSGFNPGCGTRGFNATEGWDPVTGLGTPKFKKLLSLLG